MWTTTSEKVSGGRGLRFAVETSAAAVSYAEVLRLWQTDDEFRSLFLNVLADAPYEAFRWETPPMTKATAQRPFEFVLLDSPGLAREPEPIAFAAQFRAAKPGEPAIEFPNLGNDAILVVPCPLAEHPAYGHLAAFTRMAPAAQQHALWSLVGQAMQRRLSAKPVWLSTAGAGVAWLHVRLDDRPKYYGYEPYRTA
ncbi:MAG TPA: hypothetical protein VMP01_26030 [Pirellulaceae bacterium]|nr:hypothetical protein [Pirellulaceae bacterium]